MHFWLDVVGSPVTSRIINGTSVGCAVNRTQKHRIFYQLKRYKEEFDVSSEAPSSENQ